MRPLLSLRPFSRRRGTSLVELLVVIVVFLIGILAVAQIFPGGFRILAGTRARSLASTLATAQTQRLTARPDLLPEAILPVRTEYVGGTRVVIYEEKSPTDYAPSAQGIDPTGTAVDAGGSPLGKWGQISGPNTFRRVVGETHRIGAPRFLSPTPDSSKPFGGLVTLEYGPMDFKTNADTLAVYGRDMFRRTGEVPTSPIDAPRAYEYILVNGSLPSAEIVLPAPVPTVAEPAPLPYDYVAFMAIYVNDGGDVVRREIELPTGNLTVTDANDLTDVGYVRVPINTLPLGLTGSQTFLGVDRDSFRIARAFRRVAPTAFSPNDPYQYSVVNPFLGTLLFNPAGYNRFEQRPGEARQPFAARVNYDVYDWRILHEDFRIPRERFDTGAAATAPSVRLAISPLRATNDTGADGLPARSIEQLIVDRTGGLPAGWSTPAQDHFVLLDLETGGVYYETYNGRPLLDVNKSTGRVRFLSYSATGDSTGWLLLPDNSSVEVKTANRPVRAYYSGKDEWAVQVTRAPARYTRFIPTNGSPRPATGTYYIGGSDGQGILGGSVTRLYFPPADAGRKVTIGRISYVTSLGEHRTYEGGDFVIKYTKNPALDVIGLNGDVRALPSIDVKDVASDAVAFDDAVAEPANAVRGASVVVRVFHNDAKFALPPNGTIDLSLTGNPFDRYLRQWRVDTKETFLDGGEPLQ